MNRIPYVLTIGLLLLTRPAASTSWPDVAERVERNLASPDAGVRRAALQELRSLGKTRATPLALRALSDEDIDVRLVAAKKSIDLGAREAVTTVMGWLGDRDSRLRQTACDVLKAFPEPRAISPLARALGDADADVRTAAADALGMQASPEAVSPLIGKLEDSNPQVRIHSARALARLRDSRAVIPLVGKIQDSASEVRQAVARALGDLDDARASQALLIALRDVQPDVRAAALASLGSLRAAVAVDAITSLFSERDADTRRAALHALGQIASEGATRSLMSMLGSADDFPTGNTTNAVRGALLTVGPACALSLRHLLETTSSPRTAASAAWVLGKLRTSDATLSIVKSLRAGVLAPEAAMHALSGMPADDALGIVLEFVGVATTRRDALAAADALLDPDLPDGRAVEPLAAVLDQRELDSQERLAVVRLLGRTGAARALPALAPLLHHPDATVRLESLIALARLHVPAETTKDLAGDMARAEGRLFELLVDPDAVQRLHAGRALGAVGGRSALRRVLGQLEAADAVDAVAHVEALGGLLARIPDVESLRHVEPRLREAAGPMRDALLVAIARTGIDAPTVPTTALAILRALMHSEISEDRRQVAALLTLQPGSTADLLSLVQDGDPSVRAQALWSLGGIQDSVVVATLEKAVGSSDVASVINAVAALGRSLPRPAPIRFAPTFCRTLSHPHAFVRANALAALAHLSLRCEGDAARSLLRNDPNELVRMRAAGALSVQPDAADRIALQSCRDYERATEVAAACERTKGVSSAKSVRPFASASALVYVIAHGSKEPSPDEPFALETGEGFIHFGLTDRRGAIYEAKLPTGNVKLRRPSGL